jgi:hypothetical protein
MYKYYLFAASLCAFVTILIITCFFIIGSPFEQKAIALDKQRLNDLSMINSLVASYYQRTGALPTSLSTLQSGSYSTETYFQDPETKNTFDYQILSKNIFQICLNFSSDSSKQDPTTLYITAAFPKNSGYKKGYYCAMYTLTPKLDQTNNYNNPASSVPSIGAQSNQNNPASQLNQANDTKRRSDTLQILNAIYQYKAAHQGDLPKGIPPYTDNNKFTKISNDQADLCTALVPTYLSAFPEDPSINNGKNITSCSNYDSGYEIALDPAGKVFIYSRHAEAANTTIVNYR